MTKKEIDRFNAIRETFATKDKFFKFDGETFLFLIEAINIGHKAILELEKRRINEKSSLYPGSCKRMDTIKRCGNCRKTIDSYW